MRSFRDELKSKNFNIIYKDINKDFKLSYEKKITKTIKEKKIKIVIVGPEEPLVFGIVDFLRKNKIKVFGPNKYAARLEGSKAFMKKIFFLISIK